VKSRQSGATEAVVARQATAANITRAPRNEMPHFIRVSFLSYLS